MEHSWRGMSDIQAFRFLQETTCCKWGLVPTEQNGLVCYQIEGSVPRRNKDGSLGVRPERFCTEICLTSGRAIREAAKLVKTHLEAQLDMESPVGIS